MASNNELNAVGNQGWWQGFANLFRKENHLWWRTSRWWVQALIWLAIANGILFMVIGIAPQMDNPSGSGANAQTSQATGQTQENLALLGLTVFLKMAGIAIAIGVVVLGQETLISEKQSGTAAWVLSKPVSRAAFILSKVASHTLGILLTMVIPQGCVAYLTILSITGKAYPIWPFIGALGMLFLGLLFWLTLTVMLGALSNMRGLAIGVPLFLLLGFTIFVEIAPWTADYMPWNLTSAVNPARQALSVSLVTGQSLPTLMPLIVSLAWCLIFTIIAIWRFQRVEL